LVNIFDKGVPMKRVITISSIIVLSLLLLGGVNPTQGAETCPHGNGWVKIDGLTGCEYTFQIPLGCQVTAYCYKAATYCSGPVPVDPPAEGQFRLVLNPCPHDLSHASFLVVCPTATPEPTPTATEPPEPTPTATTIPTIEKLEGFYTEGMVNGENMLKDLQVLTCSNSCSVQEVTELLTYQRDSWIVVQDNRILYSHSGRFTNSPWDYEFGEVLRQLYLKDSLTDALIYLTDTKCLQVVDAVVGEYTDRSISSFELFPEANTNDFILVVCFEPTNSKSSERLFILLRMKD